MKAYKTDCPSCHGPHFYVSDKMSHCFSPSCGYSEFSNGYSPAQNKIKSDHIPEIRSLYKDLTQYYHSCLGQREYTYLIARGFTQATIQDRMIGYCPSGKNPKYRSVIAKEAGIANTQNEAFLADRIIFPYFRTKETVTDLRGRSLDPNEELRYKEPFGSTFFRGATYPYNNDLSNKEVVIITEGEIKANIALQSGFPCMALPGMGSWRSGFVESEGTKYIILFDSQKKNSKEVIIAIKNVAKNFMNPFVATLPLYDKDKMDIDQFIIEYGAGLFSSIIESALEYSIWELFNG